MFCAGIAGMTAYVGIYEVCTPKKGAAASTVGQLLWQLMVAMWLGVPDRGKDRVCTINIYKKTLRGRNSSFDLVY